MLRNYFINKHVSITDIKHTIWHNRSIYLSLFFKTIIVIIVFYILYVLLKKKISDTAISFLFWWIWILWFWKFVVDFLNLYLDSLLLSSEWITLYLWEWLLEYRTEFFEWDKIVMINHHQKWILDKIFAKWDLIISLEQWIEFPFENISFPKKQVDKIMKLKDLLTYEKNKENENIDHQNKKTENMELFAEVFNEVMQELKNRDI